MKIVHQIREIDDILLQHVNRSLILEHTPRYDGSGRDCVTSGRTDASGLLLVQRQIQSCCSSCWSPLGNVDCSWEGQSIAHTTAFLTQDKHNRASRPAALPLIQPLTRDSDWDIRKLLVVLRSSTVYLHIQVRFKRAHVHPSRCSICTTCVTGFTVFWLCVCAYSRTAQLSLIGKIAMTKWVLLNSSAPVIARVKMSISIQVAQYQISVAPSQSILSPSITLLPVTGRCLDPSVDRGG